MTRAAAVAVPAVPVGRPVEPALRVPAGAALRRFLANRAAVAGLAGCALLVLAAVAAPYLAPYHYAATDYGHRLLPAGSPGHLLGTDQLGRDVASRLLYGLRTGLGVAVAAQLAALLLAVPAGAVAGYLGGLADHLLTALVEVVAALPGYLLVVVLVVVLGREPWAVGLAIGVTSWAGLARLTRAQVMELAVREYVEAARAMGARGPTIVLRYVLPGAAGPILVAVGFGIPAGLLAEAGLGLIGLGIQPPAPSCGQLLADGARYLHVAPHLVAGPAAVFTVAVLAFNFVAEGVRDALDVRD